MELSTIVEIVGNYQPSLMPLLGNASTTVEIMRHTSQSGRRSRHRNLQQQKLLKHTSQAHAHLQIFRSTIVEIIEAYQPGNYAVSRECNLQQQKLLKHTSHIDCQTTSSISTIVEIIEAYQPMHNKVQRLSHLQQQKLLKHTSRLPLQHSRGLSTIVEIIEAYQPIERDSAKRQIYNSRNY